MIKSIFIMSSAGEVMIEKHWRGVTARNVCDFFWDEVNKYPSRDAVPPIIAASSEYHLLSVYRDDTFVLAAVATDVPPLLCIEFLHRVLDILEDYFGGFDEATVKENFSVVYQLLEEMMDNGHPLTTEPNALKAMIKPPTVMGRMVAAATGKSAVSDVLPDGTISSMPWRKAGVKYSQNEIYLDIVEEVDAIVGVNGQLVSSEVTGVIHANSRLSGIPDLLLAFVEPGVIDDCSFHPCVRYNRFERDRVVSFVPPDGQFELMRYRVDVAGGVMPPIYCNPTISFEDDYGGSQGHIHINLGYKQSSSLIYPPRKGALLVEDVGVTIQFPKAVRTANLAVSVGTCLFDEATKVAKWTVGKLGRDKMPQMTGTLLLLGPKPEETPPMEITWKVPMASVSGLAISSLQLVNEKYRPYKGVRTLTRSGKFQV
ncbi:unnamed protein product, partial [Phaeothamnion confervicola]